NEEEDSNDDGGFGELSVEEEDDDDEPNVSGGPEEPNDEEDDEEDSNANGGFGELSVEEDDDEDSNADGSSPDPRPKFLPNANDDGGDDDDEPNDEENEEEDSNDDGGFGEISVEDDDDEPNVGGGLEEPNDEENEESEDSNYDGGFGELSVEENDDESENTEPPPTSVWLSIGDSNIECEVDSGLCSGSLEIMMQNTEPVYGYQISIQDIHVTNVGGGYAADIGFFEGISHPQVEDEFIMGFTLTAEPIDAFENEVILLTKIDFENYQPGTELCLPNDAIMPGGEEDISGLGVEITGDCLVIPSDNNCAAQNLLADCSGHCHSQTALLAAYENGFCNNDAQGINLNCEGANFDGGDCAGSEKDDTQDN
ncbi:MAG: hypothetical protein QGI45_08345, partial [Myxococcota bacterium]|nr:hypothetical protein [Myxococcota bacterium]